MVSSSPLFPASLISSEVASSLPNGFVLRPLEKTDYGRGFLECLRGLTWVAELSAEQFCARYDEMDTSGKGPYYYLVIEHEDRIVATGAVIAEKKFIQNRTVVGHIEEICVSEQHRGKGLGRVMLGALASVAKNVGCRKCSINCSSKNVDFYVKCGYKKLEIEMQLELGEEVVEVKGQTFRQCTVYIVPSPFHPI